MTEDYKEQLLNYVTGNLEPTSPTTDEIFKEIIESNRNDWIGYMPSIWTNMRIEGFIKPNENTSNLGVMYGGYKYNNQSFGFVILVDNNMIPIKYITEFDSGTKLRYIQCMIQGDDNLFYAIDDSEMSYLNYNIQNSQKRFIMLNNFSVPVDGNYTIRLRTSYILNGTNYQNFYCDDIFKENNSSHFVFCGRYSPGAEQIASYIKSIELKINVGQSNEWNYYQINENYPNLCSFVTFNNESNIKIQTLGIRRTGYNVNLFVKDYNSNSYVSNVIQTLSYELDNDPYLEEQALFLDSNNIYFVIDTQNLSGSSGGQPANIQRYVCLYHYNISTNSFETIHQDYYGNYSEVIQHSKIQLDKNQGKLYIALYNNIDTSTNKANYYIQKYDGVWKPILVGENKNFSISQRSFYVGSNFNLIQIVLFPNNLRNPTWYFLVTKEIYNPTQYNGEPYIDINVLNPKYSNLYSNGSLVFSRNLYNISKQNNMTMSSVEIPNNYLNDTTITQNDLISETNLQMNTDLTNWTKNIYEVVDLNFLNTISVIDQDTSETYLQSAIRINNAITDINDYSNMTCNKVRINYTDNTTKTFPINWTQIDEFNKETEFTIYIDKPILSIDYISNDTNTIYCTKQLEVEVGNYYTINQKIGVIQ
jgi:hypothetical protein